MIRKAITLICLLVSLCANAQNTYFNHLTPADGLSQISVNSIYADSDGVLWIATRVGLDSYNGNSIHVYSYQPGNPRSLFCNNIRHITGDGKRMLYLVCSEGVVQFDIRTQVFTTLHHGSSEAICFKDVLYMSTHNVVQKFDADCKKSTVLTRLPKGELIESMTCDSRNRLWIGTYNGGLYCYAKGKLNHVINDAHITTIYEDSKHNIWVGSWNRGFWTISPNGKIENTTTEKWLVSNFVRTFCEDNRGNIWIGTYHGLMSYNPSTGTHRLFTADGMSGSLTNSSIWSIIKDRQGTLWIGTYFGGVNYFNPENEIYTRYRAIAGSNAGLSFPVVGSMTEDNRGRLWICTEGGGMNVLDIRTNKIERIGSINIANLKVVHFDSKRNTMWVGTHLGGLYRLDLSTGKTYVYKHQRGNSHTLPSDMVRSITAYGDKLVIGTQSGVAMLNPSTLSQNSFTPLLVGKLSVPVPSVCVDNKQQLWIATEGDGVFCVNPKNGKTKQYLHKHNTPTSIVSNYINNISVDRNGRLWFAMANNSICTYNDNDDTFSSYGGAEGLSGDAVYATAPSSLNNRDILLITNRGFSVFDSKEHRFHNYDRTSGIPLESINENALYVAKNGDIYLGGIDGMAKFNERDLYKRPQPYYIGFGELYVNGEEIKPGDDSGILDEALRFTKEIVLSHDDKVFSVEPFTTNFIRTYDMPLQYRMKGVSDQWITIRTKVISFNGLSAGTYTLELSCPGSDIEPVSLRIKILPPWYMSWWAYIIYIALIGGAGWWLIREYRDRIRLGESLKFEQQHVKDIEEQNQSKLRFFTNVSHEIRTPLTVIIGLSESLLKSSAFANDVHNKILGIYRNSSQLRGLISELLDFRKQEQGHTRIYVQQNDFAIFLRENVMLFKEYATSNDIALELNVPTSMPMWFDRKQMMKVASNLISNALKHTPQGGTVSVNAKANADGTAIFKVSNTGKGIAPDDLKNIFVRFYQSRKIESFSDIGTGIGLDLTKGIVEMHHGTISVDSAPDKETTFTVILPMQREAFDPSEISDTPAMQTDTAESSILPVTTVQSGSEAHASADNSEAESRPSILIVEDNDDIRQLLVTLFCPYYRTSTAVDGREALEMVADEKPDLVLSDVLMPHMSGIDLCRAIKHDFSICHIPVVLLTARTAVEQTIEGLKTGADDYVTKPFNSDVLISRCNNLVNTRRLLQRKFSEHPHTEADVLATNPLDKDLLDRAMKIIDKYYTDSSFSVDTFAKEIGMSRTAFFNKWKDLTGDTPKGFILNMRLRKAADMLRNRREMSISEVSYANGFSSPRYFCKCFKDAYKIQPSAFRNGEE